MNVSDTIQFPDGSNTIKMILRTDARRTRKGFMGQIRQLENSCGHRDFSSGQRPARTDIPRPLDISCNTLVRDFFGVLKSPNYPSNYSPNKQCIYTLRRPAGHVCKVELSMRSFDLSQDSAGRCNADYIELPDGQRICGHRKDTISLGYKQTSDYLILKFRSDYSTAANGFNIEIRQIPYSCDVFTQPQGNHKTLSFTLPIGKITLC